jgi:hypothetical protein
MEAVAAIIVAIIFIIAALIGASYYHYHYVNKWVSFTVKDGEALKIVPPTGVVADLKFKNCVFTIGDNFSLNVTSNLNNMAQGLTTENQNFKIPQVLSFINNVNLSPYSFATKLSDDVLKSNKALLTGYYC